MICRRCLLRIARRNGAAGFSHSQRPLTTTAGLFQAQVTAQTTTTTNPRPNDLPAAISTSTAQPFSTPLTPSPSQVDAPSSSTAGGPGKPVVTRAPSSVPAGTPLKGLNFMKNKPDPVALEDHEYPDWLWTVLSRPETEGGAGADGGSGEADLFSKSKKERRRAAKALRRQQLLNPESLVPKVPLEEQTLDLPGGSESLESTQVANEAREELTKAMRTRRRKDIKEHNFLKTMK